MASIGPTFACAAITGGVVSTTCTVKLLEAVFPASSCALHCTVLTPSGNVAPEAGVQVATPGPSTLSSVAGLA